VSALFFSPHTFTPLPRVSPSCVILVNLSFSANPSSLALSPDCPSKKKHRVSHVSFEGCVVLTYPEFQISFSFPQGVWESDFLLFSFNPEVPTFPTLEPIVYFFFSSSQSELVWLLLFFLLKHNICRAPFEFGLGTPRFFFVSPETCEV